LAAEILILLKFCLDFPASLSDLRDSGFDFELTAPMDICLTASLFYDPFEPAGLEVKTQPGFEPQA
jgi:hypothetical protein